MNLYCNCIIIASVTGKLSQNHAPKCFLVCKFHESLATLLGGSKSLSNHHLLKTFRVKQNYDEIGKFNCGYDCKHVTVWIELRMNRYRFCFWWKIVRNGYIKGERLLTREKVVLLFVLWKLLWELGEAITQFLSPFHLSGYDNLKETPTGQRVCYECLFVHEVCFHFQFLPQS